MVQLQRGSLLFVHSSFLLSPHRRPSPLSSPSSAAMSFMRGNNVALHMKQSSARHGSITPPNLHDYTGSCSTSVHQPQEPTFFLLSRAQWTHLFVGGTFVFLWDGQTHRQLLCVCGCCVCVCACIALVVLICLPNQVTVGGQGSFRNGATYVLVLQEKPQATHSPEADPQDPNRLSRLNHTLRLALSVSLFITLTYCLSSLVSLSPCSLSTYNSISCP